VLPTQIFGPNFLSTGKYFCDNLGEHIVRETMLDTPESSQEEIGFIKYAGESTARGTIDAGAAGTALTGLDQAIRYFNLQQSTDFANMDYDVPIRTREGSWEAVLLGSGAVAGAFALSYAQKAGEKLAENDFKDVGLKHILAKSMDAMKTLAELIVHTGKTRDWENTRIEPTFGGDLIAVSNQNGEILRIPLEYFKWYERMSRHSHFLANLTSVIRSDRPLTIGARRDSVRTVITIREHQKPLFDQTLRDEQLEEAIFPELPHGMYVSLEGYLIRGSQASNTFGLEYMGHVINCVPAVGSVRKYKSALFLNCRVEGTVTRHIHDRLVPERRPTLIVERVVTLEEDRQNPLF
jgi:hypothetical protein